MAVLAQLKEKSDEIRNIASRYGINNIRVFGSIARQEEKPESDVDLLVDCQEDCSLFDVIALKDYLEKILGRKIDIVTEESIHWYIRDKILSEAKKI